MVSWSRVLMEDYQHRANLPILCLYLTLEILMNMSWIHSITLSSFMNLEPIQVTLENLKNHGINTVEVYGEPDLIDVKNLMQQFDSFSIDVSGITGMWGLSSANSKSRNLVTADNNSRIAAQNYVKKCVALC